MKRRVEPLPKAEWTSLVDIIFQLLIFFMVTMALGTMLQQSAAQVVGQEKKDLPKLPAVEKLASVDWEVSEGYLLHIDRLQKPPFNGDLAAYILDPAVPTVKEAEAESSHAHGPFPLDKAKRILQRRIEEEIFMGNPPPHLEIRAHEDTPFGYILDIMEFCDRDSIEVVGFRFSHIKKRLF